MDSAHLHDLATVFGKGISEKMENIFHAPPDFLTARPLTDDILIA